MSEILIYKWGKGWAVALNPATNCKIWSVSTKKRALEKAQELRNGETK